MGFGLLGMGERVRRLGGKLSVADGAEGGTLIEATIPWSRPQAQRRDSSGREVPFFAAVAHA
jgi:glucose-6-phosphate-specific signal transduction histidine kinase